ncbi:hypothetical protein AB205_0115700 [Aquarana catesbeiana]|uniref:Leucine-rich repeat and coiled-coil domain-containing protein 1 n=1 Tax=Aquarana catesbeiana TaxID=8400 RepID=A0A2G9S1R1_AQUCT|nr:hypothetical protein AB205_0115700 [Aquarana catesbeiana]
MGSDVPHRVTMGILLPSVSSAPAFTVKPWLTAQHGIRGLNKLLNLRKLNLSYNRIHDLSGLIPLHGWNHKLSHLYLHSNCINSMDHVLQSMVGLQSLAHLTLQQDGKGNRVCFVAGYRNVVLENLAQLKALDGVSRSGEPVLGFDVESSDVPNLDFLEYLITCDDDPGSKELKSSSGSVITPRIDQVLSQYRKRPIGLGSGHLSRCIDGMTSSDQESTKHHDSTSILREMRIKKLEEQISELLKALVQELDQERERRWKAEQLVVKLTENFKELQSQAKEEKDLNSMAVYTTDRIKELLLKEKNAKCTLQALMKHMQEAERKVTASKREIELLRGSVHQHKDKVQQLHELLTSREQAHRTELEARVPLNGPEFQEAVAKEVSREGQRHNQQIKEFQEKIGMLTQQYADLEDEFRAALVIEAGRFKEVKDGFDSVTAELAEHKEALSRLRLKEKQSASLIQELTTMVKEQKTRIADITKTKQEVIKDLKSKIRNQEMVAEEEKQKTVQIQLLKQEKSKLISQLTAQESLIDGLKAERKIWGQELTQQGVSLAQDRGRLEAKIEVLSTEIESLKKQNERDNDALRIKTKMVEDQTETIRKLKEGLQERDERIRKLHAQNLEMEKVLREQNDERAIQLHELKEKLERQTERKEEIKLQLEEKEAELEDVKKAYSAMNKKWQDKAELLSQLETQVRQMKENFDAKEKRLIEERDKSLQNQK